MDITKCLAVFMYGWPSGLKILLVDKPLSEQVQRSIFHLFV